MPGNVPAATLEGLVVLPLTLSTAFTQSRELAILTNEYPDGSTQRRILISNGGDREEILARLHWKLSKRLTADDLVALRNFYDARGGAAEAFIFYDPYGGVGIGNHDPTGVDPDGRYIVHFLGEWKQEMDVARSNVSLEMIELALAAGSGTLDFTDADESGNLMVLGL